MCRKVWLSSLVLCFFMAILAGCGMKDAKDVVRDLSKRSEEMESYMSHGKLTILTGREPQEYDVEVWYKKPHYYRVALKNKKKDITQILLRNDEGVYVLTPHLKKSFRFQSDWPETSGQIYLYQTIMQSIVDDEKRTFKKGEKDYQFEVAAHYPFQQQAMKQRIWLDHDLYPKRVQLFNEQNELLVKMDFDSFKIDASFDRDAFEQARNLKVPKESEETLAKGERDKEWPSLEPVLPAYVPEGSQIVDEKMIETPNGPVAIIRFQGKKSFTLTERHPVEVAASLPMMGKPVELEKTVGVLLELGDGKRLTWTYDGIDFELLGDLPMDELIQVANSTFDQPTK